RLQTHDARGVNWKVDPTKNAVNAWVNFDGTGTVAIAASYNVSSITDTGTGRYTVNFTSALTDANYAAVSSNDVRDGGTFTPTTTSVSVFVGETPVDSDFVSVIVVR
ncbi:MAG: hypothetical protein ACPG1A_12150, partial [Halioglobus sp.]